MSEEIACGAKWDNAVRLVAPSGGWWRDAAAEVVVGAVDAAVVFVVAVDTEGSQML